MDETAVRARSGTGNSGSDAADCALLAISPTADEELSKQGDAGESTDPEELLERARAAVACKDFASVAKLLDPSALPANTPVETQVGWADTLAQANLVEQSNMLFEALLAREPKAHRIRFNYAKRLHLRGLAVKAARLLDDIAEAFPEGSPPRAMVDRIRHIRTLLQRLEGSEISENADCRLLAMTHAMARYRNRELRPVRAGRIGSLTLATGSLAPGGAERQLSRLAAELEQSRRRNQQVGGAAIEDPIEVLVRSCGSQGKHDFFLPELRSAGVKVVELAGQPRLDSSPVPIQDPDLEALLNYLPAKVNFDLWRLVEHFRQTKPDVVSIWQDGACLVMGPAAVIAGVPKIQLVFRGLPPVTRRHMFLPEYEVAYRALAELPGVEFVSNSHAAAKAYSGWLDLPEDRIHIVYNGVAEIPTCNNDALSDQWTDFARRTEDADHTVGGVFRFDVDKRPQVWIRFAARYFAKHPKSRFLLVGGGRFLDEAKALAESLGVAERILFVGQSSNVGFWMNCMDVLVLMSAFEGLPNVLIEAQYLGVPVVSTPAGGSAECFLEGVTGHVLGSAQNTDLEEACEKVQALIGRARNPDVFGPATREFLEPNFSIPKMIDRFALLFSSQLPSPSPALV